MFTKTPLTRPTGTLSHIGAREKIAFTLAEVLITLGIIGVVAALTLPTLIQNYKERARITALKKNYSILSQAYQRILAEEGQPEHWLQGIEASKDRSVLIGEKFKPYMNILKDCGLEEGCINEGYTSTLNNKNFSLYDTAQEYKLILSDGTGLIFYGFKSDVEYIKSGILGNIKIFIDGKKGENVFGKDVFLILITSKYGLVPAGDKRLDEIMPERTFEQNCNADAGAGELQKGVACTAWVIYNDNMDYLHCPEKLGWNKASSCK